MRYYCKHCGSEFISGKGFNTKLRRGCFNPGCDAPGVMITVPEYETTEQYEKRTGKPWPDNAPVWVISEGDIPVMVMLLGNYHNIRRKILDGGNTIANHIVICVQSPVPPPDGWKPEEDI